MSERQRTMLFCTNCGASVLEGGGVRRNDVHVCDKKHPKLRGIFQPKAVAPRYTYNREREASIIQ